MHGLQPLGPVQGELLSWAAVAEDVIDRHGQVDFINNNIGVGFPVPIIMVSKGDVLDVDGVGRVIGTFGTSSGSWI